ncbi:YciI family protein [Algibacter sp. 2305UL17-15]|uniref:YciI family protein n=1 Tax=Algibacter sp. 2305UL17-15 TaxID=3231268 RepID=UPI00345810B6
MKKIIILLAVVVLQISCKEDPKIAVPETKEDPKEISKEIEDSTPIEPEKAIEKVIPKSRKQIKEELTAKGFKTFDYVDEKTQDTILMQQYFMAFLKRGPIRGQNEEESAELQELHMAHLKKMYDLGYADISGPFGDDGDIRGVTIYNVPTFKMADSLAKLDPMVKAGRLEIEIHPWWAGKGFSLR